MTNILKIKQFNYSRKVLSDIRNNKLLSNFNDDDIKNTYSSVEQNYKSMLELEETEELPINYKLKIAKNFKAPLPFLVEDIKNTLSNSTDPQLLKETSNEYSALVESNPLTLTSMPVQEKQSLRH